MANKDSKEEVRDKNKLPDEKAQELRAEGNMRRNEGKNKSNKLWLWLGVIILIFILVYWLFSIGIFEDMTGVSNG